MELFRLKFSMVWNGIRGITFYRFIKFTNITITKIRE